MFHVELLQKTSKNKVMLTFFLLSAFFSACSTARQSVQIPDYLLVDNGIRILGNEKALTAFIFENDQTKWPIEQYLSSRFHADNYSQKEYWINIDNSKYKIIIYDSSEFEKYFKSADYSMIHDVPENAKKGDSRKFLAISMINSYNEDCLAENSLFQNIAVKYLKNLKDDFKRNE